MKILIAIILIFSSSAGFAAQLEKTGAECEVNHVGEAKCQCIWALEKREQDIYYCNKYIDKLKSECWRSHFYDDFNFRCRHLHKNNVLKEKLDMNYYHKLRLQKAAEEAEESRKKTEEAYSRARDEALGIARY